MMYWKDKLRATLHGRRAHWLALLPLLLLAYGLRIACLDCQSLWLDEAASAYWTAIPVAEMLRDTADNLHVPGYFLVLRAWTRLAGSSAFSLRTFSLFAGLLAIPVAYAIARRFLNSRRTATLAGLLVAVSPAHIIYAQETRMYALMPTLYLCLLAVALHLARRPRRSAWLLLTTLELVALYLHLFSILMLGAVNGYLLFSFWRHRARRQVLLAWLSSQLLVALGFIPWLLFAWRAGGGLPANLGDTTGGDAALTLPGYIAQIWIFLNTGLTAVRPALLFWNGLLAATMLLALVAAFATARPTVRQAIAFLAAAILIPLLAGGLAWQFNPLTHPRYLTFLLGPHLLLLATLLSWSLRRRVTGPFAVAVLTLVLLLSAASLRAARFDAGQRRYDVAALATAIAARGTGQDLVLMPPFDRSLWYYDPAPVVAANWPFAAGQLDERPALLQQQVAGYDTLFLVEYHDLYSYDPDDQVRTLLEANGRLIEKFTVDRMDVYHYAVADVAWRTPQPSAVDIACGPLRLTAIDFPQTVTPGDAPHIVVRWRLEEQTERRFAASLRLIDEGEALSSQDRQLLDSAGRGTEQWPAGQESSTYAILPIPLGAPPLSYTIELLLYSEGGAPLPCGDSRDAVQVGQVTLAAADQRSADPYGTWSDVIWRPPRQPQVAPGLMLEGFDIRPPLPLPGQPFFVTLRWRAAEDGPPGMVRAELQLVETGRVVSHSEGTLFTRYPPTHWQAGDLFIETRQLTMPATLQPLQLMIAADEDAAHLGDVRIDLNALAWQPPPGATPVCANFEGVGALRAYDWQVTARGRRARLTLYWQGAEEAPSTISYTVFAQLLAPDLNVIAQHDGPPANGERLTTTWLPDELIADERLFELPSTGFAVDASLAVGLYDLSTLERVPATDCADQPLPGDAFSWPVSQLP